MNKILILFTLMIGISSKICFADTAPSAWDSPKVTNKIIENILYDPISHSAVVEIPIKESNEPLVDLLSINDARIIPLSTFDSQYQNTYEGWSKVRFGLYERMLKMLELLPSNIGIAYFEGFRTLDKQKEYFDKKFLEILESAPSKQAAYIETTKHVSPFIDNIPTHCTGAAIDMTLFSIEDGKNTLLDMGMFDTIFGPNEQQETFSPNTTMTQRKNRLLLLNAAIEAGLGNYGFEWWHYSYGDKMYARIKKQQHAIYGLTAEGNNENILSTTKEQYLKQMGE